MEGFTSRARRSRVARRGVDSYAHPFSIGSSIGWSGGRAGKAGRVPFDTGPGIAAIHVCFPHASSTLAAPVWLGEDGVRALFLIWLTRLAPCRTWQLSRDGWLASSLEGSIRQIRGW